jgi:hypothetical protein
MNIDKLSKCNNLCEGVSCAGASARTCFTQASS